MAKYFKIVYSYGNDEQYIQIVGDELHRAYALFLDPTNKGRAVFSGGAISSMDIKRIVPDWNRHFNWNHDYKLLPEDWNVVNEIKKGYDTVQEKAYSLAKNILKYKKYDLLKLTATEAIEHYPKLQQKEKVLQITDGINKL